MKSRVGFISLISFFFFLHFSEQGTHWTPSKMIHRLGKEINNPESVYYWAYKVSPQRETFKMNPLYTESKCLNFDTQRSCSINGFTFKCLLFSGIEVNFKKWKMSVFFLAIAFQGCAIIR